MLAINEIEINLNSIHSGLKLWISPKTEGTLFDASEESIENNEAPIQFVEGCFYDYEFSNSDYIINAKEVGNNIIQPHRRNPHMGTISPNIFVGTLDIPIHKKNSDERIGNTQFEVQSVKTGYRQDYRKMLELITEKSTDLILQSNSPVSHHFDIDYTKDNETLYQKFAFIKSIINSDEFKESVHRVITQPVTVWSEIKEKKDIRGVKRFSSHNVREIVKSAKRTNLPKSNYLRNYGIKSLPQKITSKRKTDSVDTPENRFIKHALETFLKFCIDINKVSKNESKLYIESESLIQDLESQLHHTFFNEISRPNTLKLNSPVLQRKEGYREVLRIWLMFELAAKLTWEGGEDVYKAGKKDIATLYEYWIFFKLLAMLQDIFDIDPNDLSDLIEKSENDLILNIKQGLHTSLKGIYHSDTRKLNIRFNYNRQFQGNKDKDSITYPNSGSWTTSMRPDYTLSIWPFEIKEKSGRKEELTEDIAEKEELIVHIHFDAKYKIDNLKKFIVQNLQNDLDEEKIENRKGNYKNADILKMHAYKDAIRRTGGAYVLYPGDETLDLKGFHEVIPGLGAFPLNPSKNSSELELKNFILRVVDHFMNRASQREKQGFHTYETYKEPPKDTDKVNELLPETYGDNRDLIPDETYVLVGYYNSPQQYNWIKRNGLYNFRMGSRRGSLVLDVETVSSKYLLLHTKGDKSTGDLWKIKSKGPKVYSDKDLLKKKYPKQPTKPYYLVIEIEKVRDVEFEDISWEFKKLNNYKPKRASAIPYTTTLAELMKVKVKN